MAAGPGLTPPERWRECQTPEKTKFLDRAAALRRAQRPHQSGKPCEPYRCPCGYWHVRTARKKGS